LASSGSDKAPQYRSISGLGTIEEIKNRVFEALK
ncbi:MAG: adenylate kinase, partial [Candidatus Aphodousia sp.]|nr:adenylate kinase [Candidatus Aphodousia sp.]